MATAFAQWLQSEERQIEIIQEKRIPTLILHDQIGDKSTVFSWRILFLADCFSVSRVVTELSTGIKSYISPKKPSFKKKNFLQVAQQVLWLEVPLSQDTLIKVSSDSLSCKSVETSGFRALQKFSMPCINEYAAITTRYFFIDNRAVELSQHRREISNGIVQCTCTRLINLLNWFPQNLSNVGCAEIKFF